MSNEEAKRFTNFDEDPQTVLKNIKETIDGLESGHVPELEASLTYILSSLLTTMQKIYSKNVSDSGTVAEMRSNLQVAADLVDTLNDVLRIVVKNESIVFNLIPNVSVNMVDALYSTFDHCKCSQKIYSCYVGEILELFRKAQEAYTKVLNFIDTHLTIDFFNETHVVAYKKIVDTILQISRTLSGVNMKSMADSWKSFIGLVQKSTTDNMVSLNLSPAIQILTEEINNNLILLTEEELSGKIKFTQNFKRTGFLVKVVLKLFEAGLNLADSYDDIFNFWITIFSWHDGFFRTNNFLDEIVNCVSGIFQLSLESMAPVMRDSKFLKFCVAHHQFPTSKQNFAFLILMNTLMKNLPQLLKSEPKLVHEFKIITLIRPVFNLTRNCYFEYYCDYNSEFYDELVTNIAVVILLFPHQFLDIENVITECIVGESIWTSLIVTDTWCLVLKYSTEDVCRLVLNNLMQKIEELGVGIFHETSATVRLKILAQRIFKSLSNAARHDEVAKYNPTVQLFAWKILTYRNVPLSYRYYVEFLISDIFETAEMLEKADFTYSDMLHMMEMLGMISYAKLNDLEINTTRWLPIVIHLWSFDIRNIYFTNSFLKYFLCKLIHITAAVSGDLSDENCLLILTQLKLLVNDCTYKILISDILGKVTKRNFSHFSEKHTLFSLMFYIFKLLLSDDNGIVVQLALDVFSNMINNNSSCEIVMDEDYGHSFHSNENFVYYSQKCAVKTKYNLKYFEKILGFKDEQHCCDPDNDYQPACKKIKSGDADTVISNLNDNTEKMFDIISKSELSSQQRSDIKSVIDKLETLLTY